MNSIMIDVQHIIYGNVTCIIKGSGKKFFITSRGVRSIVYLLVVSFSIVLSSFIINLFYLIRLIIVIICDIGKIYK